MNLNTNARKKLAGTLRVGIESLRFNDPYSCYLSDLIDHSKFLSNIINTLHKDQKDRIENCLGESPFVALYLLEIQPVLSAVSIEDKTGRKKLTEIIGFTNSEAWAEKLTCLIESLPRSYIVSVLLPNCLTDILVREKMKPIIGDYVSLIGSWNNNEISPVITKNLSEIFSENINNKSEIDGVFINFKIDGLYSPEFEFIFENKVKPLFKSFFGFLMGFNILQKSHLFENKKSENGFYVSEVNSNVSNPFEGSFFDESFFNFINSLEVSKNCNVNIVENLKIIIDVLNIEMSSESRRLMQASRWLFDSRSNSDRVMGFMQLAICAEVLLGTSNENEGITKTLADRCAYLIASNSNERDSLISEFREIYKLRSKIVHNGQTLFKQKELQHLSRLNVLCNRILQRESELLTAESFKK